MPPRAAAAQPRGAGSPARSATIAGAWRSWAAHPAWLDGWAAVWGAVLAAPSPLVGGTWSRVAAVGVVVWLLSWSRAIEGPLAQPLGERIPGGRRALGLAALAVSAVLGTGPLIATAAWLAVGIRPAGPNATSSGIAACVRRWLTALGAWLSLGGGAVVGAYQVGGTSGHVLAWLGAFGPEAAVLAGCAVALGWPAGADDRGQLGIARTAAFVTLAAGLAAAGRPAGLWLAALCAAAIWPRRAPAASSDHAAASERHWLPLALGLVCAVDRLLG